MQACLPRSYLTPVRDEEAESQRKARSRQARQTRRSTQGVTLTELKEAQSIFGQTSSDRPADGAGLERRAVAKDGGLFQGVEAPSRDPEESHLKWDVVVDELGNLRPETEVPPPSCTSSPAGCSIFDPLPSLSNRPSKGLDENANERRNGGRSDADAASELALTSRERRPARERDQGTGASYQVQEHDRASRLDSGSGSSSSESAADRVLGRAGSYTRRENRLASLSKTDDEGGTKEYKKMYEDALAENEKLKSRLEDSKQELAKIRIQLEKVTQKHDRISERSSILETEKREKRILEKKVSDMEEELKVLTELKSDNQRLKDENGALIRVISKLSK